jgi:hypothetical protein
MLTLTAPALLGTAVALALGGSLAGWGRQPLRWWPVALGALVTELVLARIPTDRQPWVADWGHWLWVGTLGAVLLVVGRNAVAARARRVAWLLAGLGVALNLGVVLANGGYMPVDQAALDASGQTAELAARPRYRRDVAVAPDTRLPWLADVIGEPDWLPRRGVLSLGDLVLMAGVGWWTFETTLAARRRPGTVRGGSGQHQLA